MTFPAVRIRFLATCILASSMSFVDGSVTNVALPAIGGALHANGADLQWVSNAYLLPLSALLFAELAQAGPRIGAAAAQDQAEQDDGGDALGVDGAGHR